MTRTLVESRVLDAICLKQCNGEKVKDDRITVEQSKSWSSSAVSKRDTKSTNMFTPTNLDRCHILTAALSVNEEQQQLAIFEVGR